MVCSSGETCSQLGMLDLEGKGSPLDSFCWKLSKAMQGVCDWVVFWSWTYTLSQKIYIRVLSSYQFLAIFLQFIQNFELWDCVRIYFGLSGPL